MTIKDELLDIQKKGYVDFLDYRFKILPTDCVCIKEDNFNEKVLTRFNFGELSTHINDIILLKEYKNLLINGEERPDYKLEFYLDYTRTTLETIDAQSRVY